MNSFRPPRIALTIIFLIVTLGCIIRVGIAGTEFLWLDELHTSWAVDGPLNEVASRASDGNQSPVYFWLTWICVNLIGHSEFSLRLVSIASSFMTALLASWLTWKWTKSAIAATLVAWLIATDIQFVYYGTEARPYALLQFLSVIQIGLFCRAMFGQTSESRSSAKVVADTSLKPHWELALVSALLVYTHLTSVWLFVAETVFLIVVGSHHASRAATSDSQMPRLIFPWAKFFSTALVFCLACLPLIAHVNSVASRKENWQSISSIPQLWFEQWPVLALLIGLPTLIIAIHLGFGIPVRPKQKNSRDWHLLTLVFLWATIPFVGVVGCEYFQIAPLALHRYTLVGAVGLPVYAGLCVGCLSWKSVRLLLASLIIAAQMFQNPIIDHAVRQQKIMQLRFEDWETPISEINETELKSNRPVFLFANLIEDRDAFVDREIRFQNYLLFPVRGLYRLDESVRIVSPGPTLSPIHFNDSQIEAAVREGGAWAIVRGTPQIVIEIFDELQARIAAETGKPLDEVRVSVLETQQSRVYLISIDW